MDEQTPGSGRELQGFPRRIAVIGASGSGKTTAAKHIADTFALTHVDLDGLYWDPNWTPASPDVFRERVSDALAADGWIADGNKAQVRDLTWGRAEHVIWLDYSLPRTLLQVTRRTFHRRRSKELLWGTNRENLRTLLFSRESLFLWILTSHYPRRRRYPQYFLEPQLQHLTVARVRTPRELEAHLAQLQALLREGTPAG